MDFIATKIKGKELKPGDLFSSQGEVYWGKNNLNRKLAIGEKVYIRTDIPLPKDQLEEEVYRIEVRK